MDLQDIDFLIKQQEKKLAVLKKKREDAYIKTFTSQLQILEKLYDHLTKNEILCQQKSSA